MGTLHQRIVNAVKVIVVGCIVFVGAGAAFYACEVAPMEECMDNGHSFVYCQKLLNRNR